MSSQGSGAVPPRCKHPYPEDMYQYDAWAKTAAEREMREEVEEWQRSS